jgi:hypothetical protein
MSVDDKLYGWDAGLSCLIRQLEAYKRHSFTPDIELGWNDAIIVAQRLISDARTQKGFVARECAAIAGEQA